MAKMFANGLGKLGFNLRLSHTQKMVFDASLLNTQHYKLWIKAKWSYPGKGVELSRERSNALPYTSM